MPETLKLHILEDEQSAFEVALSAPLEVGRQRLGEPEPYTLLPPSVDSSARLVVARASEENCSRNHVHLLPLPNGLVRVANGSKLPLPRVASAQVVPPGSSLDLRPPFSLVLGPRTLLVSPGDSVDDFGVHGLEGQSIAPGSLRDTDRPPRPLPSFSGGALDELVGWLRSTVSVLQSALGSADYLDKAATSLVDIVGMHSGRVLVRRPNSWEVAAAAGTADEDAPDWKPSRQILARVLAEKRTFWQRAHQAATPAETPSLLAVQSVVASPLLNAAGEVVGALYGERRRGGPAPTHGGGKVEAALVELLAGGVSAGLTRQEHEQAALAAQLQFEQFFGKQLAERLRHEPGLLEGREAEVTLLFCDVRGYSRASEHLGPAGTVRWINDVMGELSRRVLAEDGVLVDYIGDELFAMWGAPEAQPDSAERAARAALAMRGALVDLNARWQETLKGAMEVGLGLNTGIARVGNTGSEYKFKYGPLGNAVNLASRVQGLTKYLKCRLLATATTRAALGAGFLARRVCRVRVVNIREPVDLYEVEASGSTEREEFFRASEAALDALEAEEFALAARRAGSLLEAHPHDGPLLLVLSRASTMLVNGGAFDPVWEPPGK